MTNITVIIPCADQHRVYLPGAVQSVVHGVGPKADIVVVDDACKNEIVRMDPAKVIRCPAHRGRCEARNIGARSVETPWLFFLDADDWLMPTAIADMEQLIVSNKDLGLAYADYEYVTPQGERVVLAKPGYEKNRLMHHNGVNIGMLVRRDRFLKVGGFDRRIEIPEYWDFFLRYTANPKVCVIHHWRPFFTAQSGVSIVGDAEQAMARGTRQIQGLIGRGHYRRWMTM